MKLMMVCAMRGINIALNFIQNSPSYPHLLLPLSSSSATLPHVSLYHIHIYVCVMCYLIMKCPRTFIYGKSRAYVYNILFKCERGQNTFLDPKVVVIGRTNLSHHHHHHKIIPHEPHTMCI